VQPIPDAELNQFVDKKLQGSKGKKVQNRLESSIKGFHDAFTNTSEKWRKAEGWPPVLKLLEDLHRSVERYYTRLFKQLGRQTRVHQSDEPLQTTSEAINC
jgi:hypothetical protein